VIWSNGPLFCTAFGPNDSAAVYFDASPY